MNIPETAKRLLRKAFSLNPVTLKELRQLVRTKVIIAAMVIYPILLFVVTISMISGSVNSAVANKTPVQSVTMGPQILGASGVGLAFLGCILFPLFSGIRMAQESAKGRTDLQFITALHPVDIVSGKIAATFLVSLVFAGISAPFMAFAYMLHGITLEAIGAHFVAVLLASAMSSALAVSLGAPSRVSVPTRITRISGLYLVGTIYFVFVGALFVVEATLGRGRSFVIFGVSGWDNRIAAVLAVIAFMWISFLKAFAASSLMPLHSDYNNPLRRVETVCLLIICALVFVAEGLTSAAGGFLEVVAVGLSFVAAIIGWRAMFTPPGMSRVSAARAPRSLYARLLKFPFASSAESGVVFSILFAAVVGTMAVAAREAFSLTTNVPVKAMSIYCELTLPPLIFALVLKGVNAPAKVYKFGVAITMCFFALMHMSAISEAMDVIEDSNVVYGNTFGILGWDVATDPQAVRHSIYTVVSALFIVPLAFLFASSAFRSYRRRDGAAPGPDGGKAAAASAVK